MSNNNSYLSNYFHRNGRALGSIGYFVLLMIIFFIKDSCLTSFLKGYKLFLLF